MLTPKFSTHFPKPARLTLGLGLGLSLIALTPQNTHAQYNDYAYGHAQVTLGFPHGEVTVGHTWGDPPPPRTVIVEEVTRRYPIEHRSERDRDRDWNRDDDRDHDRDWNRHWGKNKWKKHHREDDEDRDCDRDDDEENTVIIEKHVYQRPAPQVVIIEHAAPPRYCERNEVIQRVYNEPERVRTIIHEPTTIIHEAPIIFHDHSPSNNSSQNQPEYYPQNPQQSSPQSNSHRLNPHGRRASL